MLAVPLGTVVHVTNLANGRVVNLLVNDRGPYAVGRVVDASHAGAVALGFAIPAPTVVDAVRQLLATGHVRHAYLGIVPLSVTDAIAAGLDIAVDRGVVAYQVPRGTPAARAGVRNGDVIVRLDGVEIASAEDLFSALRRKQPGDQVAVTFLRNGDRITRTVRLANVP
jgi:S1-C subfamily serine protease